MSIFQSWLATSGFFFAVFLVGKYLQHQEREKRKVRKEKMQANVDAIRSQSWDATTFGTIHGKPTQYEQEQLRQAREG